MRLTGSRQLLLFVVSGTLLLVTNSLRGDESPTAEQVDFFESKIRPVLVTHCFECHSGDATAIKGGLRLDSREGTLAGGDSGPAVVPGKPSESVLIQALRYEGLEMPPKGKLSASILADFERWVAMGAPDPRSGTATRKATSIDYAQAAEFWAFQPPVRRQPPAVKNEAAIRNDIDRFVLHELEQRGMKPAPRADRRVLIRRAYFDLIGLPPEPDVVERFVNDTSEGAFARVVDELLASPHYGERWGRYWLDLARYAEDQAHTFKARMYPQGYFYRDWVVQALNDDMPYDQFLRLQIAGDLLDVPEPYRHRAALGLFALGPVYYQDNGEQDRALADEWDDRVDTLMRGTQALTLACARCHDHKYDPISMADYYGLAGIFASSEYRELPAVPEEIVEARRQADRAVQDQQLAIDAFLTTRAPDARLKLVSTIPAYLAAASRVIVTEAAKGADLSDKQKTKRVEQAAKEDKLNAELLRRWVAWLREEPGSGAVGTERPYLNAWREFRVAGLSSDGKANEQSTTSHLESIGRQLQQRAQELLDRRTALARQFGPNFAFVAAEDRTSVEPGTVPLGNLFDDQPGTSLASALMTDPFRATATSNSLGVDRVAQGWGSTTVIAEGIRFDFTSLGSDSRQHGQITNDGWSKEGGIRTQGQRCAANLPRNEQGIGMHANALVTFDLDEIRRAGLIPASEPIRFRVDRAGINDDAFGQGSSVHIAVVVSRPHQRKDQFDAILAAYVNGQEVTVTENDMVYYVDGTIPAPLVADGRFASFDVPLSPEARYLTIVATGAQLSDTENTISSDHAVLSGARLEYAAAASQLAQDDDRSTLAIDGDPAKLQVEATFLSELFDEKGVLGLPAAEIGPLLEGEDAAELAERKRELEKRQKAAADIRVAMAHTLVDGSGRDLKIYLAGDPKKQGEVAQRGFPAIFSAGQRSLFLPEGSGRRQLADAIASPDNPLTARVMANRVWSGHFGAGLVRTVNNFGQLGDRPSHPELLDWLAVELMQSGWSLKHLHRRIMLSATYQQSSVGDPANAEIDGDNRLLWCMNRRRLEVEPWRDAVLSVSGQLQRDLGGPSSELNPTHRRRTLYGFVSRHRLNDLLRLFDFPDPNITAGERTVTTVPLQQLFVLNSEFMVSQAKAMAARLHTEAETDEARIGRLFALLYGRPPTAEEAQASLEFLTTSPSEAGDSLTLWEQYCLAMLGTNEFAYID